MSLRFRLITRTRSYSEFDSEFTSDKMTTQSATQSPSCATRPIRPMQFIPTQWVLMWPRSFSTSSQILHYSQRRRRDSGIVKGHSGAFTGPPSVLKEVNKARTEHVYCSGVVEFYQLILFLYAGASDNLNFCYKSIQLANLLVIGSWRQLFSPFGRRRVEVKEIDARRLRWNWQRLPHLSAMRKQRL
jgi:hypothetical protein